MSKHKKPHNTFNLSRIPWSGGSLFLSHTSPFFRGGEQRRKATRTRIRLKRMGWDDVIREESAGRREKKKERKERGISPSLSLCLSFLFFLCFSHTGWFFRPLFPRAGSKRFLFFLLRGRRRKRENPRQKHQTRRCKFHRFRQVQVTCREQGQTWQWLLARDSMLGE